MTNPTLSLVQSLAGAPIGYRGKHKRTVRKWANALGHDLGHFHARKVGASFGRQGFIAYHVAHCMTCDAAAFTGNDTSNPALDRVCPGETQRQF